MPSDGLRQFSGILRARPSLRQRRSGGAVIFRPFGATPHGAIADNIYVTIPFSSKPPDTPLFVERNFARHYAVERSESDGIKDLRALAESSKVEEMWLFVRGKDSSGAERELWYEIGELEHETGASFTDTHEIMASIRADAKSKGISLSEEGARATIYHFHPAAVATPAYRESPSAPDLNAVDIFEEARTSEKGGFPSVDGRIVTPAGLWSISWTKPRPSAPAELSVHKDGMKESARRLTEYQLRAGELCLRASGNDESRMPVTPMCRAEYGVYAALGETPFINLLFEDAQPSLAIR